MTKRNPILISLFIVLAIALSSCDFFSNKNSKKIKEEVKAVKVKSSDTLNLTSPIRPNKNEEDNTNFLDTDFHKNDYNFVNLTKRQNKLVFYKYCNADILQIRIKKDSLFRTTHQDGTYKKVILKKERVNEREFFITYRLVEDIIDTIYFKKDKQLWNITGRIYTESKFKQNYKYIEQPCTNCFTEEECDEFKKNKSVKTNRTETKLYNVGYKLKENSFTKKWGGFYQFSNGKKDEDWRAGLDYDLYISLDSVNLKSYGYQYVRDRKSYAIEVKDSLFIYNMDKDDEEKLLLKLFIKKDEYVVSSFIDRKEEFKVVKRD